MGDLFGTQGPDIDAQIREVQRELAQRERVYPRLVASGQLTRKRAEQQTATMQAVLETLHKRKEGEKWSAETNALLDALDPEATCGLLVGSSDVYTAGDGLVA